MALERMQVTNHERWGNLVKTWSTGKNYLDDDNEYPIPTNIEEFKEQLAKAQVFMTVPDRYTKVQFVEQHIDTIVVRLPPAFAIADNTSSADRSGILGLNATPDRSLPGTRRACIPASTRWLLRRRRQIHD